MTDPSLCACWLTAAGNHLWVGMGAQAQGCARQTIWRLDGTDLRAAFQAPASVYLPPAVVGDDAHGLWTVE